MIDDKIKSPSRNTSKYTKSGLLRKRSSPPMMTDINPEKLEIVESGIIPLNILTDPIKVESNYTFVKHSYIDDAFRCTYLWDNIPERIGKLYRFSHDAAKSVNQFILTTNIFGKYTKNFFIKDIIDYEKTYEKILPKFMIRKNGRIVTNVRIGGRIYSLGMYSSVEVAVKIQTRVLEYLGRPYEAHKLIGIKLNKEAL